MKLLVTGADGFVGKNLLLALRARTDIAVLATTRESSDDDLKQFAEQADCVVHLAATIRPTEGESFTENLSVADKLIAALGERRTPVIYTSSTMINSGNEYGNSKRAAEDALTAYGKKAPAYIYRLPNIFGKFTRPNYNSAVGTFCHNIARDLPITINDPSAKLTLVYIDDVIESFLAAIDGKLQPGFIDVSPQYETTVGEVATQIEAFKACRKDDLLVERVGIGLTRALYATYVSYLPPEKFAYDVKEHADPRGKFVEMLKTPDCGQFSYFTAHPGITRGGHYHHSKTEKFLVISGRARFAFRHMVTGERFEIMTSGDKAQIVETIPGWTHDITNIGDTEMVVMLWANEIFDRNKPDTYAEPV